MTQLWDDARILAWRADVIAQCNAEHAPTSQALSELPYVMMQEYNAELADLRAKLAAAEGVIEEANKMLTGASDHGVLMMRNINMLNENQINSTYDDLRVALADYRAAEQEHIDARARLDAAIAKALLAGEIIGKNETERQAAARTLFAAQFTEAEGLESRARLAKLAYDCAQIEAERVRSLLRLMEATKTAAKPTDEAVPF